MTVAGTQGAVEGIRSVIRQLRQEGESGNGLANDIAGRVIARISYRLRDPQQAQRDIRNALLSRHETPRGVAMRIVALQTGTSRETIRKHLRTDKPGGKAP